MDIILISAFNYKYQQGLGQFTQMMNLNPNGIASVGFPVEGANWNNINNKTLSATATNYLFVVNDGIAAKDFLLTATPWADYVFDKDYKLMSLKVTEDYIKLNHHLPEIPTIQKRSKKMG